MAVIGAIAYFAWPKKEAKTENKQQTNSKEEIQRLQTQLSSLKQKINDLSDNTKKTQLENKLTNTESQINNLSNQESVQKSTIKKLEKEIEEIKKELKGEKPDSPKDNPPHDKQPNPDGNDKPNNKGWNYVATKINDNTFKYHITLGGTQLSFRDFIAFSKNKKNAFFKAFQGALKDANSKFPAYFWKCPPVSKNTLDKPFEFVVIKSDDLNNITQNHKPFEEYLVEPFLSGKYVVSFPNQGKDAILIVPSREFGKDPNKHNDYKNLSQFTKNASLDQQKAFWQEVAQKFSQELEKDSPRWLNTHGLGVSYLHVRIDEKPKYYGDYEEYKKWE